MSDFMEADGQEPTEAAMRAPEPRGLQEQGSAADGRRVSRQIIVARPDEICSDVWIHAAIRFYRTDQFARPTLDGCCRSPRAAFAPVATSGVVRRFRNERAGAKAAGRYGWARRWQGVSERME